MACHPRPGAARRNRRHHAHLCQTDDALQVCGVEIGRSGWNSCGFPVRMADLMGETKGLSMSQFPPPQYPPQTPPPPGFSPGPMPPQGPQSNGLAITSLIMGILSCIPGVGLLAILFGALGMGKAKDPRVGGKGMAIVGIVLGLISIVAYAAVGYGVYVVGSKF